MTIWQVFRAGRGWVGSNIKAVLRGRCPGNALSNGIPALYPPVELRQPSHSLGGLTQLPRKTPDAVALARGDVHSSGSEQRLDIVAVSGCRDATDRGRAIAGDCDMRGDIAGIDFLFQFPAGAFRDEEFLDAIVDGDRASG